MTDSAQPDTKLHITDVTLIAVEPLVKYLGIMLSMMPD